MADQREGRRRDDERARGSRERDDWRERPRYGDDRDWYRRGVEDRDWSRGGAYGRGERWGMEDWRRAEPERGRESWPRWDGSPRDWENERGYGREGWGREHDPRRDYASEALRGRRPPANRSPSDAWDYDDQSGRDLGSESGMSPSGYSRPDYGGDRYYRERGGYAARRGPERGWWDRAADEVSSWFGDEEADRRRRFEDHRDQHRGRGPRGYKRSDERIREDVSDRLTDNPILDASEVEVVVMSAEVTLNGLVDSRYSKRLAEDLAEEVSGVQHVQNNLRIRARGRERDSISGTYSGIAEGGATSDLGRTSRSAGSGTGNASGVTAGSASDSTSDKANAGGKIPEADG
jgi:osmotically-inducible protein OsmY